MKKVWTAEELAAVMAEFDGALSSLQSKLAGRLILQARAERDEALARVRELERLADKQDQAITNLKLELIDTRGAKTKWDHELVAWRSQQQEQRIAALEAERDENLRLIGVVAKNRDHFMAKCEKAEMRVQQLEAEVASLRAQLDAKTTK